MRSRLRAGGVVFGSEINRLRSHDVARVYAAAGFDFVFIDMEHSAFSLETVADMIETARRFGLSPIVRVPQAEYAFISRVLDCGARGIIVPRVNTPQQVRDIASWVRYPPRGIRGFADTLAQTDGRRIPPSEFIAAAERDTLVVIQIERQEAVGNLDAMLSIEGIDVACLGCLDLSVDLGIPGELSAPAMIAAIQKVVDVAARNQLASGIITGDIELIAHWLRRGVRFVSYSSDIPLLQSAATAAAARLRALAGSK
ncbi:MAG TPA: aldolase/citrate lyase family protein [Planctomycetaceae bacterium]|nr:aldolase/citrate lyase family protein [Planctomycetaceae bacterium]